MTVLRGLQAVEETIQENTAESVMTFIKAGQKRYVRVPLNIMEMLTPVLTQNVYPAVHTNLYEEGSAYDKVYQELVAKHKQLKADGASEKEIDEAYNLVYDWSPKEIYLFEFLDLETNSPIVIHSPKGGREGKTIKNLTKVLTEKVVPKADKRIFEIEGLAGNKYIITALDEEDIPADITKKVIDNFNASKGYKIDESGENLDNATAVHDPAYRLEMIEKQGLNLAEFGLVKQASEDSKAPTELEM